MKAVCIDNEADYADLGQVVEIVGFIHVTYSLRVVIAEDNGRLSDDLARHYRIVRDDEDAAKVADSAQADAYLRSVAILTSDAAR